VPPKITEKAARQPTTKTREKGTLRTQSPDVCRLTAGQTEKMSAHDAEPRCLGLKPRLCGWKKKGAETRCAGRGAPKTFGGRARSIRDRLP